MPSVTLVPSGYTGLSSLTQNSSYPISNGYANSSSTNYARFTLAQNATGYLYYTFDTSSIPAGATITSVTARGKARVGNTTRVTNTVMQLYSGTTAKGSNRTFASTTASTQTITAGSWTRSELTDLRILVGATGSNSTQEKRFDFYGADVTIEYEESNVPVTGVSLDKATDSVETGSTTTLTATVAPSNASNKSVTWSTSNASVATVSGGVVTGVSAGTARITVTTVDGSYTAYCDVTVTPAVTYEYVLTNTMEPGKDYLIANGNSGSVYLLTNDSGGSRTLQGVVATVSNNRITITGAVKSRALFSCVRYTSGNDNTITVSKGGQYLYCDNANGLRMNSPATLDRFWHYRNNKFWQFKSTSSDGYSDSSSEYKYYLNVSNGNFTDSHVDTTSVENSNLPAIYIYAEAPSDSLLIKDNGSWVTVAKAYKKINGAWVEQSDLTQVFDANTSYVKG